MKRFLLATAIVVVTVGFAAPALAADVGVSISIGEPGFYGRLDIGGYPPPQVIYHKPVMVKRVPDNRPPVYLRVPPGHAKHWGKHCHEYNACGERVFFVRDNWYSSEYLPRYHEQQRDRRDERRDDHRGEYRDEHRNNNHERGHGRDR